MMKTKKILYIAFLILSLMFLRGEMSLATPVTISFSDTSGLSSEAEFSVVNGQLQIILTNTSTGTPQGFSNSDQLLTSVAFDLPDGAFISAGGTEINTGSYSVDFDNVTSQLGEGDDVSVEWGFGNVSKTGFGSSNNFVSTMKSGITPFEVATEVTNLDGPINIDGPQAGLTNGVISLGGLGAIHHSIIAKIDITGIDLDNIAAADNTLSYISSNNVIFEWGSDAAFGQGTTSFPVPEPSTLLLLFSGISIILVKNRIRK